MDQKELIEQIKRLKKEKQAIILAHNYQLPVIQDIADFVGDSLQLSRQAQTAPGQIIVFCGVNFMAETAKILSPEKTVLHPAKESRCPMADMINPEIISKLKEQHPRAKILSYVNTTAEVKAESDVCCTSSNAAQVAQNMDAEKIIFVPDQNLATYVAGLIGNDKIIPYQGYCYVHQKIKEQDVEEAKKRHPDAVIIVHPECKPEVINLAHEVASTGGMMKLARELSAKKFIIGTEEGLLHRLNKENPQKQFFTAGPARICHNMKLIRLEDVYWALKEERYQVVIDEEVRRRARLTLDKMLQYTG